MSLSLLSRRKLASGWTIAALLALSLVILLIQPVHAMAVNNAAALQTMAAHPPQLQRHEYPKLSRAVAALEHQQYKLAYATLLEAHEQDPGNLMIMVNLASLLEDLGEKTTRDDLRPALYGEAQRWYERIYSLASHLDSVAFKVARLAQEQGHYPEALAWYQKVELKNPHNAVLHFNMANLYEAMEDVGQAEHHYRQALLYDRKLAPAYNNLALLLMSRPGDAQKEIEQLLKQALTHNPKYVYAHLNLGNLYLRQERWSAAYRQFKQVLALAPTHPLAQLGAGNALSQMDRLMEACQHYRSVIASYPQEAQPYYLLAMASYRLKNLDEAIEAAQKYLVLAPHGQHTALMQQLVQTAQASTVSR